MRATGGWTFGAISIRS